MKMDTICLRDVPLFISPEFKIINVMIYIERITFSNNLRHIFRQKCVLREMQKVDKTCDWHKIQTCFDLLQRVHNKINREVMLMCYY